MMMMATIDEGLRSLIGLVFEERRLGFVLSEAVRAQGNEIWELVKKYHEPGLSRSQHERLRARIFELIRPRLEGVARSYTKSGLIDDPDEAYNEFYVDGLPKVIAKMHDDYKNEAQAPTNKDFFNVSIRTVANQIKGLARKQGRRREIIRSINKSQLARSFGGYSAQRGYLERDEREALIKAIGSAIRTVQKKSKGKKGDDRARFLMSLLGFVPGSEQRAEPSVILGTLFPSTDFYSGAAKKPISRQDKERAARDAGLDYSDTSVKKDLSRALKMFTKELRREIGKRKELVPLALKLQQAGVREDSSDAQFASFLYGLSEDLLDEDAATLMVISWACDMVHGATD